VVVERHRAGRHTRTSILGIEILLDSPAGMPNSQVAGPMPLDFVPVSPSQMYMFLLEHVPDNPRDEPASQVERLRTLMAGYGGFRRARARGRRRRSSTVYRPLEWLLMPQPWHRGRVLLLGDAAHATTPISRDRRWLGGGRRARCWPRS
jgi:2-polyprenyl-6-methoxyphenol hydroxylase-like FAD-dependent oxidoreductase